MEIKYLGKRSVVIILVALLVTSFISPIFFPLTSFGYKEARDWLMASSDFRARFGSNVELYVLSHSGKLSTSEVNCSHFTFAAFENYKVGFFQVYMAKMPKEDGWKIYDSIPSIFGYTEKSCVTAGEKPAPDGRTT